MAYYIAPEACSMEYIALSVPLIRPRNMLQINIMSVWNTSIISNCAFQNNTNNYWSGSNEYVFGGAIHVHSSNFTLAENTFQHNLLIGVVLEVFTNNTVTFSSS